jgi:predicted amidohydrolase YtcJ
MQVARTWRPSQYEASAYSQWEHRRRLSLAGKETKRIDLSGRTAIPGINDGHHHFGVEPDTPYDLPIKSRDPSWQEIKDALATGIAKVPKGAWILGEFGETVLDDPQATRMALDQLAPDRPVMVGTWSGHTALLNTAALRKLGVREDVPNPKGGVYARNAADQKLTGMTFEFARFQIGPRLCGGPSSH